MSMKQNFDDAAVAYYRAHKAWKAAPDGPEKVETKRLMRQKLGKFIEHGDLLTHEKKPAER